MKWKQQTQRHLVRVALAAYLSSPVASFGAVDTSQRVNTLWDQTMALGKMAEDQRHQSAAALFGIGGATAVTSLVMFAGAAPKSSEQSAGIFGLALSGVAGILGGVVILAHTREESLSDNMLKLSLTSTPALRLRAMEELWENAAGRARTFRLAFGIASTVIGAAMLAYGATSAPTSSSTYGIRYAFLLEGSVIGGMGLVSLLLNPFTVERMWDRYRREGRIATSRDSVSPVSPFAVDLLPRFDGGAQLAARWQF